MSSAAGNSPAAPTARRPIAVLVSRFPLINEAYILREINELERQGQPVLLVPVIREPATVMHEEARPWLERALHTRLISWTIIISNLRQFVRTPGTYLRLFWTILTRLPVEPEATVRNLAVFPKSVHLARVLPRQGVEHVHAYFATHTATIAYVIAAFSRITYSFTVHGPDVFVRRPLLREKIRNAKFIRAVSVFNKAFLLGLYPSVAADKIEVVHVGVNPDVYRQADAESRHSPGTVEILSVAGLNPFKGMIFLVEACSRLAKMGVSFECRIVGDGPLRPDIEERIAELGLSGQVHLLGSQPQHVVARLMGQCDVFMLPSIIAYDGQMDGIPIALVEAMATGRPVIAADISGIPELIRTGVNGMLVDSTNPEQLAALIRTLAEDSQLRQRLGAAARRIVEEQFNVRSTVANLMELFERRVDIHHPSADHLGNVDWSGLGVSAVAVRRVHERRDSSVTELTASVGDGARELIVKTQKGRSGESRPPEVRARHEFEVLEALHAGLSGAGDGIEVGVPRPLHLSLENASIVMERARGQSLEERIIQSRLGSPQNLMQPLTSAGLWLREMQRATRRDENGAARLDEILERAADDLQLAGSFDADIRRSHSRLDERLRRLHERTRPRCAALAGCHGDYWPGNLFTRSDGIEVIDFEGFHHGLGLEDVAYFLVHLELYFTRPVIRRHLSGLEQAFKDGYRDGAGIDDDALRLLVAAKGLAVYCAGPAVAGEDLRSWWRRRGIRNIIFRALQ